MMYSLEVWLDLKDGLLVLAQVLGDVLSLVLVKTNQVIAVVSDEVGALFAKIWRADVAILKTLLVSGLESNDV